MLGASPSACYYGDALGGSMVTAVVVVVVVGVVGVVCVDDDDDRKFSRALGSKSSSVHCGRKPRILDLLSHSFLGHLVMVCYCCCWMVFSAAVGFRKYWKLENRLRD